MSDLKHDIERYQNGEMTPKEMHALERKALDDPFLADALEGSSMLDAESFGADVKELEKRILTRKKTGWLWPLRIAAAITLLAVATFMLWPSGEEINDNAKLAMEKREAEETTAKPESSQQNTTDELEVQADENNATSESSVATQQDKVYTDAKPTKPLIAEARPKENSGPTAKTDTGAVSQSLAGIAKVKPTEPVKDEGLGEAVPTEIVADDAIDTRVALAEEDKAKKEEASRAMEERKVARRKAAEPTPSSADVTSQSTRDAATHITGTVTSLEDGSPLPGINVVLKGTNKGTVTNADGKYSIEVAGTSPALVFSFIGLRTIEKTPAQGQNILDVELPLDQTQLSEVVVTGYGAYAETRQQSTFELAHAEMGDREFKKYLEESLQYPQDAITYKVEGRVTIEFTVEPNGSLSDIQVIRGIGSGCDEELIRLIKQVNWVPSKENSVPVKDKIRVRHRFRLPN